MGWRHFEFTAPKNWDVAMEGQAGKVYYFRLVDPYRPQMEVNWEPVPFEKALTPEDMFKRYREELDKKLEKLSKGGAKLEVHHVSKESVSVYGHEAILWVYSIEREKAAVAFWYCEKSERAVTLVFTPERLDVDFVKSILAGLKCHYEPGEKALWTLLIVNLYMPQSLQLAFAKFTTAYSLAVFRKPDEYFYVVIGYSGITDLVMSQYGKSVKKWFEKTLKKELGKSLKVPLPNPKYAEQDGRLTFRGESFSIPPSRKKVFAGEAWHEERVNRFIVLAAAYEKRDEEQVEELLADVRGQLKTPAAYTLA